MKISVCICTWNRATLLAQTLQQMHSLQIPDHVEWELLVVNNNCTDETDEVLTRHSSTLPLRRLFEKKPGLSNARNCAMDNAAGEIILWTDDDVLVSETWLSGYVRAAKTYPDAAFFGGPVFPWFQGSPPVWLETARKKIPSVFALIDLGEVSHELRNDNVPYGANYGIRRSVQMDHPYDPELGRKQDGLIGGEETTVLRALVASGRYGRWVPSASVRHFVPRDRQTLKYVRRIFYGLGAVEARKTTVAGIPMLFGRPRWLFRAAVTAEIRYRLRRLMSPPDKWLDDLVESSQMWGQLTGK